MIEPWQALLLVVIVGALAQFIGYRKGHAHGYVKGYREILLEKEKSQGILIKAWGAHLWWEDRALLAEQKFQILRVMVLKAYPGSAAATLVGELDKRIIPVRKS